MGLKALVMKIEEIRRYLEDVESGKLQINNKILFNLQVCFVLVLTRSWQDIFNLLPNLNIEDVIKSFSMKTNDFMHMTYVCSLVRSLISLHNLINNKIANKEAEREVLRREKELEEAKKKKKEEKAKEEEKKDA